MLWVSLSKKYILKNVKFVLLKNDIHNIVCNDCAFEKNNEFDFI